MLSSIPSSPRTYAILIDGGFLRAQLNKGFMEMKDVRDLIEAIKKHELFEDKLLYRAFYYDGVPLKHRKVNPLNVDKSPANDNSYYRSEALFQELRELNFVAVRLGTSVERGWNISTDKLKKAKKDKAVETVVSAKDISPNIQQKGVDMRIGLDIASISLKRYADAIVLVSGDSDFSPALKFARTEGRHAILFTLGYRRVKEELRSAADVCVGSSLSDLLQGVRNIKNQKSP